MFTRKDSIQIIIKKSLIFTTVFILVMNVIEFGLNITDYTYEVVSVLQVILTLVFMYIFSLIFDPQRKKKANQKSA